MSTLSYIMLPILAFLLLIAGSRIEIAMQQADMIPPICIVERPLYIDSQKVLDGKSEPLKEGK